MYKVFEVNDCFEEWGISAFFVGATSIDDLIEHFPKIGKECGITKKEIKKIVKDREWRIKEVDHLFTDKPYTTLTAYGYIE